MFFENLYFGPIFQWFWKSMVCSPFHHPIPPKTTHQNTPPTTSNQNWVMATCWYFLGEFSPPKIGGGKISPQFEYFFQMAAWWIQPWEGWVFPPGCGSLLEGDELILSASLMKKWCFLLVVATQILVYVHPYLEEMFNLTGIFCKFVETSNRFLILFGRVVCCLVVFSWKGVWTKICFTEKERDQKELRTAVGGWNPTPVGM